MIIRVCTTEDYERIHALNTLAFGYDYPLDKTKERLYTILQRSSDRLYVAELDNNVVGYIHGSDYECTYSGSLKNIMAIAVFEECRGKGVGKALLKAIEDWAKQDGCVGVRLVSGSDRVNAHEFYLRCGYNQRKVQKNFFKLFDGE